MEETELVLLDCVEDESDDVIGSLDDGAAKVYVEDPSIVVSPVAPLGAKVISVPPTSDTRVTYACVAEAESPLLIDDMSVKVTVEVAA